MNVYLNGARKGTMTYMSIEGFHEQEYSVIMFGSVTVDGAVGIQRNSGGAEEVACQPRAAAGDGQL